MLVLLLIIIISNFFFFFYFINHVLAQRYHLNKQNLITAFRPNRLFSMQALKGSTLFNKLKAKIMQILCTGVSKHLIASQ